MAGDRSWQLLSKAGDHMLVRVRNPQYDRRHLYFFTIEEFNEYQGEEVKLKWAGAHELALKTDDAVGLRVIQREHIISIDGQPYKYVKAGIEALVRTVAGSKGNQYTVKVGAGGSSCTCSGFQFRGKCKHVEALAKELA